MTPYFERDGIAIYHGKAEDVLPLLSGIDAVVTDPPYGVGLTGKLAVHRNGDNVIRPGSYATPDTPEYIAEVVVPVIRDCIAMSKAVAVTPGTRNLWLYPPADDMGCFYSAGSTGKGRWGFTTMQPILYYGSDPYLRTRQGARANSHGQTYPNDANNIDHPCAKPIRMWRWLVARASLPGETVLDPFGGSGTTMRACMDLGRRGVMIEIEERYCEIAARRLQQAVLPLGDIA